MDDYPSHEPAHLKSAFEKGNPLDRNCTDCGLSEGMRLQNVIGTEPTNIPLLYICTRCGTTLTIPPGFAPDTFTGRRDEPEQA